jgi:hypothetical protein
MLFFLSKAREASGSEAARVRHPHRRRGRVAAWPLAAHAQQGERMRRIGVLLPAAPDDAEFQSGVGAFLQGLAQLGWIIGRNIRIETRWTKFDPEETRKYAAELVALAPDVIHGMMLMPRASLAWQHAFGTVTPSALLTFQSTSATFGILGVPIVRDAALVEAGGDLQLGPQTKVGVAYFGQLANNARDHSVKANFSWRF